MIISLPFVSHKCSYTFHILSVVYYVKYVSYVSIFYFYICTFSKSLFRGLVRYGCTRVQIGVQHTDDEVTDRHGLWIPPRRALRTWRAFLELARLNAKDFSVMDCSFFAPGQWALYRRVRTRRALHVFVSCVVRSQLKSTLTQPTTNSRKDLGRDSSLGCKKVQ